MIKLARGGIVDALKRYDRGLRVRWSQELKKWCIEEKVKRKDLLPPPVVYEPMPGVKGAFIAKKSPYGSERYIQHKTGYAPICYVDKLNWEVYDFIIKSDTNKYKSREEFLRSSDEKFKKMKEEKNAPVKLKQEELTWNAYDKFKYLNRTNVMGTPHGI